MKYVGICSLKNTIEMNTNSLIYTDTQIRKTEKVDYEFHFKTMLKTANDTRVCICFLLYFLFVFNE